MPVGKSPVSPTDAVENVAVIAPERALLNRAGQSRVRPERTTLDRSLFLSPAVLTLLFILARLFLDVAVPSSASVAGWAGERSGPVGAERYDLPHAPTVPIRNPEP